MAASSLQHKAMEFAWNAVFNFGKKQKPSVLHYYTSQDDAQDFLGFHGSEQDVDTCRHNAYYLFIYLFLVRI